MYVYVLIHAQAHSHREEDGGKNSVVAAESRDDVGGDDIQHHVQGLEPVEPAASVRPSM